MPKSTFVKWVRRIAVGVGGLVLIAVAILAVLSMRVRFPGDEITPAGMRRDTSFYLPMRDGTIIAVDLWLPPGLKPGERVPVLMRNTRYWRAVERGWAMRPLIALHVLPPNGVEDRQSLFFNREGFAILMADMRGTGASSGTRFTEYSPDEIADIGELAGWAARQPWSNGLVGSFGVSYEGNTAELAAAAGNSAVRAVAPLYDDFDTLLGLAHPGGVYDSGMIEEWSNLTTEMDHNGDICKIYELSGWNCRIGRAAIRGVKRVDADGDGAQLAAILAQRNHPPLVQSMGAPEFRDDNVPTPQGPINLAQITPFGLKAQIESSGAAMMVWCGWLDAGTCDGTLSRYGDFKNPQQVVIGAYSHGGGHNVDPFLPLDKHNPPDPPSAEQFQMQADFFHHYLRAEHPQPNPSSIRYYTMGEGHWHTTTSWPPSGIAMQRFYFDGSAAPAAGRAGDSAGVSFQVNAQRTLSMGVPTSRDAADSYPVDYTTTTGKTNRWNTQLGGYDVVYPDRAHEDSKLLTFTGPALASDTEISGSPVVTLELASTEPDGALFVYLEDVAPGGRVTYVDEGMFRVINRKIVSAASLPYVPPGPAHSYLRTDAQPLIPGQAAEISFSLFPTSVLLRKGHSIRVAIAGADASMFTRVPASGTGPTYTIFRQANLASFIELPTRTAPRAN